MILIKKEEIKYGIVHHSAVSRMVNSEQFKAIRNYHIQVRGFGDIGYHWLIEPSGQLKPGRDERFVGAHAKTAGRSMNFRSIGICVAGHFEVEDPTKEQIATLEELLERLRAKYNIPRENILGHKEIPYPTLCPGKNLLPLIKVYRRRPEDPEPVNKKVAALDEIVNILKKYDLC